MTQTQSDVYLTKTAIIPNNPVYLRYILPEGYTLEPLLRKATSFSVKTLSFSFIFKAYLRNGVRVLGKGDWVRGILHVFLSFFWSVFFTRFLLNSAVLCSRFAHYAF